MVMVHKMFRRELQLAPDLVRQVACGDITRARDVAAHLRLISATLHHHHAGEDRYVWPLLAQRAPSEVSAPLLCALGQHREIDAVQAEVEGEIPVWSFRVTEQSRARLADALDRLTAAATNHMEYEERHLVPLMEQHIGMTEWNEIVRAMTGGIDPGQAPLVLGMSMYEADPDIIEHTIVNMPPQLRAGIRCAAALAYAEHAQAIHGTPTPLRSTEIRR